MPKPITNKVNTTIGMYIQMDTDSDPARISDDFFRYIRLTKGA